MITIVGLDLSLTSTGISINDDPVAIPAAKLRGPQRLVHIRDTVLHMLAPHSHPLVVIEGYSFGSKNSQAHAIGELGGVVRTALWEKGIPYVDVPPTSRAKFATGRGNAGKNEVMSAISARTGRVWSGAGADDECDAWILEECGRVYLGTARYDWPQTHLAALDKIDWSPVDELSQRLASV